uniref:Ovule protein n=1 Tax=Mesocestoides corti TaxID=53468 RepID=A0A5K3FSY5_MESCO
VSAFSFSCRSFLYCVRSCSFSLRDYSAIGIALGCATCSSNNNYACNLFIHLNAQLSCTI